MAKIATYFDHNLQGRVFDVLAENEDGTVHIGKDKVIAVRCAAIVKEPKEGCVVIEDAAPAPAEESDAPEAPESPKGKKKAKE